MDAFTPGYQFARQYLLSLNAEVIDSEMYHLEECFRQSKKVVDLDSLIRGVQHGNLQEAFSESIGSEHDELATICTTYASSKHPIVRFSGSANNNLELKPVGLDMFSGVAGLGYLINKGHIHLPDHEKNLFFDRYLADLTAFKFDGNTILGGALVGPVSCLIPLFGRSLTTSSFVKMIKSELIRRLSSAENLNSESSSLIAGLAGLLALSSAFYIAYPDEAWKRISQLALRKLISRSVSDGDLLLFPYDSMVSTHDSKCLSGLSHGQSGVAYSLAMYGLAYPEAKQECSNLIARTLRFEFENYLKDGNWPDFRFKPGNTESVHKFSWAHGGAGVLLALDFISKNYSIVELDNFLSSINLSHIFQRHLGSAPPFSVLSVATGEMGVELIRRKLLNTEAPVQPQRRRPLGIGIVNGAAGSYLSRLVLNSPEAVKFPLLPHEFVLEDLR
ncbi:hypothetical protein BBI10_02080 [Pseudomonas graminis]|uniref:Lanthionine synthetase C-like protein n=2 Tax=Pseudomonas graminis TaxID=158627 RepID=A0A1C2EEJ5_9PSED|nr:hypothetical protein BBI10_02080 [Pseudomonas graminis]